MTARKPAVNRWAPVWTFAVRQSRKVARLTAENRELRTDLAVARASEAAMKAHFDLAVAQRDGARDLIGAIAAEPQWTADDEAFLRSLGERPA